MLSASVSGSFTKRSAVESPMELSRIAVCPCSLLWNIPWHEYTMLYFSILLLGIRIVSRSWLLSTELL